MKFIHISDLHIHTFSADNRDAKKSLGFIKEHYPDHHLIVTGDITDDGAQQQYENAFKLLKPFLGKISICPGNHDFGAVGSFYSRERAERFDELLSKPLQQKGTFTGDTTPVVDFAGEGEDRVMLIALDSNLETQTLFDFACGEIGSTQLEGLAAALPSRSSDLTTFLFFHHHAFTVNDPFMELKDAEALARTIYGKVDVMLFGHKHQMMEKRNTWGCQYILASDNTPGKDFAKEIEVSKGEVKVHSVPIA